MIFNRRKGIAVISTYSSRTHSTLCYRMQRRVLFWIQENCFIGSVSGHVGGLSELSFMRTRVFYKVRSIPCTYGPKINPLQLL